jgi:hypothetical protein
MYRPIPQTPSDRDRKIYYDYLSGMRTQQQLAEEHNLTQARVSQIVKQFKDWRIAYAASEEYSGPEQDFLANDALLDILERGKQMALHGYAVSCEPQEQEVAEGERRGRWVPAKPDMRCVKQYVECGEKTVVALKNMEAARYLIKCDRDRDPKYQAEKAQRWREECERRVDEQIRRDREEAERRDREEAERRAAEAAAAALIKSGAHPEKTADKRPPSDLLNSPEREGALRRPSDSGAAPRADGQPRQAAAATPAAADPRAPARDTRYADAGFVCLSNSGPTAAKPAENPTPQPLSTAPPPSDRQLNQDNGLREAEAYIAEVQRHRSSETPRVRRSA